MSESTKLLRLIAPADKEVATGKVNVLALISGETLVSKLSLGYARKKICLCNASNASSGELYIGPSGVTVATGMKLPKNEWVEVACSSDLALYVVASGAGCELRTIELS